MLQLKQKGEDLVVFIHAALSNDNVQRPVNLKEITVLIIPCFCVRSYKNISDTSISGTYKLIYVL